MFFLGRGFRQSGEGVSTRLEGILSFTAKPLAHPHSHCGSQGSRGLLGLTPGLTRASPCRLFDLEPDLLPLFQYNCRQYSSPKDCLSSPEFLDHIRKVRGRMRWGGLQDPAGAFLGENEGHGVVKMTVFCPRPGLTALLLLALCAELDPVWASQPSAQPAGPSSVIALGLVPGSFGWCWRSSTRGRPSACENQAGFS